MNEKLNNEIETFLE